MKSGKDFLQANNAQVVVDEGEQVIASAAVTNQAPEAQHLPAMLAAVEANLGARTGAHQDANTGLRGQLWQAPRGSGSAILLRPNAPRRSSSSSTGA